MQTRYLFKNTLPARMIRTLGIDFFVNLSKFRHFEQTSLILITLSLQFPRALYFRPAHSNGKKQPPIAFVPKAQSWLPGLTSVISELWR